MSVVHTSSVERSHRTAWWTAVFVVLTKRGWFRVSDGEIRRVHAVPRTPTRRAGEHLGVPSMTVELARRSRARPPRPWWAVAKRTLVRLAVGERRTSSTSDSAFPRRSRVLASDAISSTAYASQEILIVLIPAAGLSVALNQLIPISIIVMVLLVLVVTSYRQTIFAYPGGGGVLRRVAENLGEYPVIGRRSVAARRTTS